MRLIPWLIDTVIRREMPQGPDQRFRWLGHRIAFYDALLRQADRDDDRSDKIPFLLAGTLFDNGKTELRWIIDHAGAAWVTEVRCVAPGTATPDTDSDSPTPWLGKRLWRLIRGWRHHLRHMVDSPETYGRIAPPRIMDRLIDEVGTMDACLLVAASLFMVREHMIPANATHFHSETQGLYRGEEERGDWVIRIQQLGAKAVDDDEGELQKFHVSEAAEAIQAIRASKRICSLEKSYRDGRLTHIAIRTCGTNHSDVA